MEGLRVKYETIFLDIDGTILRSDHSMESSTKYAIEEAKQKGLNIVLATGRPYHEIGWLLKELKIDSVIAYNGSFIIHLGSIIQKQPIPKDDLQKVINRAEKLQNEIVMYTDSKTYVTNETSLLVNDFLNTFQLNNDGKYTEEILEHVLGLCVITTNESDHRYYDGLKDIQLSQVNVEGMHHCYDVIRDSVNKGEAVKYFIDFLCIPKEKTIAIGDGINDKEMLSVVGAGIAMGNSHSELLQSAKYITTDVNNSGVFNALIDLGVLD